MTKNESVVKNIPYYVMSKAKRMGRPKLPKSDVRKVYPLRLSDAERSMFEAAAAKISKKLPEWIRDTLTKGCETQRE